MMTRVHDHLHAVAASPRMTSNVVVSPEELVRLTRLVDEAGGLGVLVRTQYELRSAVRRALVSQQWPELERVQRQLADSPALAARFNDNLYHELETPELSGGEPFGRLHGLVLAIPVALTCKAGTLASLPLSLETAFRETLQTRFPGTTSIRLVNRLVPQLAAHSMGARAFYELIRELAAGGRANPEQQGATEFHLEGRGHGQHYLFALALTPRHEDIALHGELDADLALVKWATAQTESLTSACAERGWPVLLRVSAPRRLRQMLASPLSLSEVWEVDNLLGHVASRLGRPVTALKAELGMRGKDGPGVEIQVRERVAETLLARAFYRLPPLGADAGAYRVAVRLASAGVELAAVDDSLARIVERAVTLMKEAPSPEAETPDRPKSRRFGTQLFRARFSRPPRQSP
jgi:hypothetical protein